MEIDTSTLLSPTYRTKKYTFILKLLNMVNHPINSELISWSSTGTTFTIHDLSTFEQKEYPEHFPGTKIGSLWRQLNLYGFIRVTDGRKQRGNRVGKYVIFKHEHFKYDRLDLIVNIRRKKCDINTRPRKDLSNQIKSINFHPSASSDNSSPIIVYSNVSDDSPVLYTNCGYNNSYIENNYNQNNSYIQHNNIYPFSLPYYPYN